MYGKNKKNGGKEVLRVFPLLFFTVGH